MTRNSTESICTAWGNDESNFWKFRDSSQRTDIDPGSLQDETVDERAKMLRVKRLTDFIFGLIGIVCLAPLWILIEIVIKTCIQGSALFRQTRIGYHKTKFQILKFRTMNEGKQSASIQNHIPLCGKILRRLRLDELPQLINIVKGEMSFVGPRPYIEQESIGLPIERYKMRPGMTGLAQVNGNTELSWDERTAYDLYYIENYTLWMDIGILLRTIKVIILGEKACVRHMKSAEDR